MKTEWDIESAIATYNVEGWGEGYFTVNSSGNVEARPLKNDGGSIDLLEVVNEARARNLSFPMLIRFQDLLRHRVEAINRAFQARSPSSTIKTTIAAFFRSRSTSCAKWSKKSSTLANHFISASR